MKEKELLNYLIYCHEQVHEILNSPFHEGCKILSASNNSFAKKYLNDEILKLSKIWEGINLYKIEEEREDYNDKQYTAFIYHEDDSSRTIQSALQMRGTWKCIDFRSTYKKACN